MHWGRKEIDKVAVESATTDYEAFEAIGLEAIENAAILDMGYSAYGGLVDDSAQ